MKSYMPGADAALENWLGNFLGVAGSNLAALGLTAADLTPIATVNTTFSDGLSSTTDLKSQYEGSVKDKDIAKKSAQSAVRVVVKRIQAHPGVSAGLKAQLRITVSSGVINRTPPVQPVAVIATPQADGTNSLKWGKAANKTSTQYAVLAKPLTGGASVESEAGWTIVGLTTASRFQHNGVTPGAPMAYKIMAVRAGINSTPSLPVIVYGA